MERLRTVAGWLHRRASDVASLMLAVMFIAFICQVVFRYLLNLPVGKQFHGKINFFTWFHFFLNFGCPVCSGLRTMAAGTLRTVQ